jgi:hypothetical protein
MFQLFKKRNFSDYISDTFSFFRITGKHFFKNYFIINGTLLILLMVLTYFVFKVYFEMMFANIGSSAPNFLEDYFNNNIGLIIGVFLLFFLLIMFISLINYAFPIIYMNLYDKHKGNHFESKEIIAELKSKFGKMLIFLLVLFLLGMTAGLIVLGLVVALMFILVGFLLLIILGPALLAFVQLSFYEYLNAEIGIFNALGKGFDKLKQNFWPIIGSTIVMYFIVQIVISIFSMVPYIIGIASVFTSIENQGSPEESLSFLSIMMVVFMCLAMLFSYILNNLLVVNSGIIYYSLREQNENRNTINNIDLIGTESE